MFRLVSFFSLLLFLSQSGLVFGYVTELSVSLYQNKEQGSHSYFLSKPNSQLELETQSAHYYQPFYFTTHSSLYKDSLKIKDTVYSHQWKRATIWSACLPGAGQIYNEIGYRRVAGKKHRAWWKVPIIYGALGATGYFFYQNLLDARAFKEEWLYREANAGQILNTDYADWSQPELLSGKGSGIYSVPGFDITSKRRDMLLFGFVAIWGLQVVEALVDGHFVHFDVSEDLSLSWSPVIMNYSMPGLALKLELQ
jgi:hypothetical protein